MRLKCNVAVLFLLFAFKLSAQSVSCYPSNWWTGMKNNRLQILVHGKGIGNSESVDVTYSGVTIEKVNRFSNPNYLALDLVIFSGAQPGVMQLQFKSGKKITKLGYELKASIQ
jgi:hypothetical protein